MRKNYLMIVGFLFTAVLSVNCQTNTSANDKQTVSDNKLKPCKFLSASDAERILGQPVQLITNSWTFKDNATRFDCNYRGINKDKASGREINLFFALEEISEEQVKQLFDGYRKSNDSNGNVKDLSGLGDAAFTQSDEPNFHLVLVRKGKHLIRLKINKAVEATSLEELKSFAKRVVGQI